MLEFLKDPEVLEYMIQISGAFASGLCMGFGAIGAGTGMGLTAGGALEGMARQPKVANDLLKTMLIGQAVTESPAIFALVTAILLIFLDQTVTGMNMISMFPHMIAIISAGICMGFGAFGPGLGDGYVSKEACKAVARTPDERGSIMKTMLIGQATAQSTSVYAFVVSLCLIYMTK
ncbi:MAG TPA: ATP synthase F0 subunit C [bacterium]|nr:ATP synthase F0 subunit C [bacterium]